MRETQNKPDIHAEDHDEETCPDCGEELSYSFVIHCEQCFHCGWLPCDYDEDEYYGD